jgi:hypothetical protein
MGVGECRRMEAEEICIKAPRRLLSWLGMEGAIHGLGTMKALAEEQLAHPPICVFRVGLCNEGAVEISFSRHCHGPTPNQSSRLSIAGTPVCVESLASHSDIPDSPGPSSSSLRQTRKKKQDQSPSFQPSFFRDSHQPSYPKTLNPTQESSILRAHSKPSSRRAAPSQEPNPET